MAKRKKKIEDAFALFDKEGKGCLIQEEVSTVMRYLGAFPRERDVVETVLPDMMEDEPTAFVYPIPNPTSNRTEPSEEMVR